jgi:hypothetical protein
MSTTESKYAPGLTAQRTGMADALYGPAGWRVIAKSDLLRGIPGYSKESVWTC